MPPTPRIETPTPADPDERRASAALAALAFAVAAPATYLGERLLEHLRGEAGDPRLVLAALHTVYYWRVGVALWWGVVIAVIVLARLAPSAKAVRLVAALGLCLVPLFLALALRFP